MRVRHVVVSAVGFIALAGCGSASPARSAATLTNPVVVNGLPIDRDVLVDICAAIAAIASSRQEDLAGLLLDTSSAERDRVAAAEITLLKEVRHHEVTITGEPGDFANLINVTVHFDGAAPQSWQWDSLSSDPNVLGPWRVSLPLESTPSPHIPSLASPTPS